MSETVSSSGVLLQPLGHLTKACDSN
ncbi:hypothetical protein CCACVL1_19556 [Corchorus capsularis]|uniref:Uncharacterized protein n=1 Tax=Corchorus capsularis TaxID=210143 RepID=A0A1R3HG90_COCAP|nr:hypothetical protein CCACVL1_19556 [Corchorus capsularis]